MPPSAPDGKRPPQRRKIHRAGRDIKKQPAGPDSSPIRQAFFYLRSRQPAAKNAPLCFILCSYVHSNDLKAMISTLVPMMLILTSSAILAMMDFSRSCHVRSVSPVRFFALSILDLYEFMDQR